MVFRFLLVFALLMLPFIGSVFGQDENTFKGKIVSSGDGEKIPFVHLILDDTLHLYSDMDGSFSLPYYPKLLRAKHYYFNDQLFEITDSIPSLLHLSPNNNPVVEHQSDPKAIDLIRKTLSWKKINKESKKKYTYKSYNKFTVTTNKTGHTKKIFNDILKFLSYNLEELDATHLFLMESVSEVYHSNNLKKKERIIGIRSTGIQLPSTYTSYVHPNPFPLYKNYISIANTKYISPLCHDSPETYAFKIVDTAYIESDTIFTVKFYPFPAKSISTIKGILYISTKDYGAKYFTGSPLQEGKVKITACQEYEYQHKHWFPSAYRTSISVERFGAGNVDLKLSARSFIFDFTPGVSLSGKDFSEVVLEYDTLSSRMPEDLWEQYRQEELSEKDRKTFYFFDSTKVQKRHDEVLKFGERIYFGVIPIGKVNLDVNKVIYTNYLEGLRVGLGFHTNEKLSRNFKIGGYGAYGFKDKRWKYGADVSYGFNDPMQITTGIGFRRDVYEAGAQFFPFDIAQYSTEPLRKYQLRILDYYNEVNSMFTFRPVKYLKVNSGFLLAEHFPSYDYQFKNTYYEKFDFTEFTTGFRYAFGEEYIKTPTNTFYLGSSYPIFWFNFTKGIKSFLGGDFNYARYDFKVQETFKFFRFGTSGVQIIAGFTVGEVPYTKLYNMRGSMRHFSVVIHNSFESMHYNEFLSDRYVALFYSHDFGQLYTPYLNFRPNLVMVHNFGFGSLKNQENHALLPFKTMEMGYFESGVFLKNLIVINLSGLRTGLGLGLFTRYGPYANKYLMDNMVLKLSTNFLL